MSLADLIRDCKDVKYDDLVWQNEIKTAKDVVELQQKGYNGFLLEEQFKENLDLPTDCICYAKGIIPKAFYWNRKTMAATEFVPQMFMGEGLSMFSKEDFFKKIEMLEKEVAQGDYHMSILGLQDGLRIQYFNMLYKGGHKVKDLYSFFMGNYNNSDYGFNDLDEKTFEWILSSKTEEQKKETVEGLKDYPDVITIYRGQTKDISTPEEKSYSWSTDLSVANFFASRYGGQASEIVIAEVEKSKVIEYITDRGEKEILVKFDDVVVKDKIDLWGVDKVQEILPIVMSDYHYYKDYIEDFEFVSEVHGRLHTQRVILLALILAYLKDLDDEPIEILCTAGAYHDTGRDNDGEDCKHGKVSKDFYERTTEYDYNPIVAFLIEYHCLDDELGYAEIERNPELNCQKDLVIELFKIFKDADALDRVRLGLKDLDMHQLRLEESKHLPKIARMLLDSIE